MIVPLLLAAGGIAQAQEGAATDAAGVESIVVTPAANSEFRQDYNGILGSYRERAAALFVAERCPHLSMVDMATFRTLVNKNARDVATALGRPAASRATLAAELDAARQGSCGTATSRLVRREYTELLTR